MPWKPVDKQTLPSEEDMKNALIAIEQLQLQAAGQPPFAYEDLARLLKDLDELRAWIAPVRRVPFEILAQIIIMSAELLWWSPALAAGVCHFWREVALATPRAWSYINLRSKPPLAFASAFFDRSKQCLLHVIAPEASYANPQSYANIFGRIAHRIECLVLTEVSKTLFLDEYPHLTRLSITYPSTPIPLKCLGVMWFPELRYVNGAFSVTESMAPSFPHLTSPPIERLIIATDRKSAWIAAIRAFSKSLKALHITVEERHRLPAYPSLELPKVKHLAITTTVSRNIPWNLVARTPALKTYSTIEGDGIYSFDVDVDSVTHLQCWDPIPLLLYTRLRCLRVYGYDTDPRPALAFIDQLCGDYGTCAELEFIMVASWKVLDTRQITQRLEQRNNYTGVNLKLLPDGHSDGSWPGAIHISCPTSMPRNVQSGVHYPYQTRSSHPA